MNTNKDGILDILEKSKGYKTALLTTFNFEIGFFEKAVLSRLLRNDIRSISVFVDAKELSKALEKASPGSIGQRYAVNPVYMQASFHPKVILLLGDKKARLIVASANLTLSGYCINNEVFNCIDYNDEQSDHRSLIYDTIRFFERCNQFTAQLDNTLIKSLRDFAYYRKSASNGYLSLFESTEESILKQVKDSITEPITDIIISVPYYDNSLSALRLIHESFPDASIHLFLQYRKSTYPENNREKYEDHITVYETILAPGNENSHFYHGKVFLFKGDEASYILYGSSNCTMSALTKAKTEEGNVEANLFARGTRDEYDSFFEQFPMADGKKPDSQIMTYDSEAKGNYFFKYGLAEKKLVLHIGYHQKAEPTVYFHDTFLDWKQGDQEIIVEMDSINVDSIFDIVIRYENREDNVRCWYINREVLELNRISVADDNSLQDAADFGIGEKFLPDYEKLLKEMDSCKADFLATKERIDSFLTSTGVQEENAEPEESDGDEDYIVTVNLTDADYAAYKNFKLVERIRNRIISRHFQSSSLYFKLSSSWTAQRTQKLDDEFVPKRRRATSEEKRFERFVKRCVRGMLDKEFAEITDITQYYGLIVVVFDIFEKYNREEIIAGIFPDEYVIITRCDLLSLFLQKKLDEWEYREKVIAKIIDIILDNHEIIRTFDSIEQQGVFDQKNRKLLLLLDDKFSIRENFMQYIVDDREKADTIEAQNKMKAGISYVDNLFGYRTLEQIKRLVRKNLGKASALVPVKGTNNIVILVFTDTPGKNLKPDTTIIRELAKYSARVRKLNLISIVFKKEHPKITDSVVEVKHLINLDQRKWSHVIISGRGKRREYPSSFLSW